ncbi:MAG: hypothetical protein AAF383_15940 [Cyanobacteria bacterium P01_A01_bin.83]
MTKVTILCEDNTHERFIREYLICRGFADRDILPFPNVKGKKVNNNNAFVIKNYKKIVTSYRSRKNNQDLAIVVMIDADDQSIYERLKQFHIALDPEKGELNQDTRFPKEKIAIFIPARNIETWFYYINSEQQCNEKTDYKKLEYSRLSMQQRVSLAKVSAKKLAQEICQSSLKDDAPMSLHQACEELKRLM